VKKGFLYGTALTFLIVAQFAAIAATQTKAQKLSIINGPVVESAKADSAVIAWTTNTGGSSVIHYGTDPNNLSQTAQAPYADNENTSNQTHRVTLRNLKPGTKYYYVVDSGQGEGTGSEAKGAVASFTTSGSGSAATSGSGSSSQTSARVPLMRFTSGGQHFYAASNEGNSNLKAEGTTGYLLSGPADGAVPFYRLVNTSTGGHFYTADAAEKDRVASQGYKLEGITGYIASSQQPGTTPLYRASNASNGDHFYTTDAGERDRAIQQSGFKDEGIAGYIWTSQQ
jgi:hypothetical protein